MHVYAPSPLRSTIHKGLNSGSGGANPTPKGFSGHYPHFSPVGSGEEMQHLGSHGTPSAARLCQDRITFLLISSLLAGARICSPSVLSLPWYQPEADPSIQAKPHTDTTLSSLPWDIKSNKETLGFCCSHHATRRAVWSGLGLC